MSDLSGNKKHLKKNFKVVKRTTLILGCFLVIGVITLIVFIDNTRQNAMLLQKESSAQTSTTINTNASKGRASDTYDDPKPISSPTTQQRMMAIEEESNEAKIQINSHIPDVKLSNVEDHEIDKSNAVNSAPVKPIQTNKTVPTNGNERKTPELKGSKTKATDSEEKIEPTREEIIVKNSQKLFGNVNYYPPINSNRVDDNVSKFQALYGEFTEESPIETLILVNEVTNERIKQELAIKKETGSVTKTNSKQAAKKNPKKILLRMGDLIMGQTVYAVNSDFKVDVFVDIQQPPLKNARLLGNFTFDQYQDSLVLKFTKMEMNDKYTTIEAYGVDTFVDNEPSFDNEVDSHFFRRFVSRASAYFIEPFIDFVTGTNYVLDNNGNVIGNTPKVEGTTDRIIGGLANVAKGFIPDLEKYANIPPTIKIPNEYPIGVIFVQPLYAPKENDVPEKNSDKRYDDVIPKFKRNFSKNTNTPPSQNEIKTVVPKKPLPINPYFLK